MEGVRLLQPFDLSWTEGRNLCLVLNLKWLETLALVCVWLRISSTVVGENLRIAAPRLVFLTVTPSQASLLLFRLLAEHLLDLLSSCRVLLASRGLQSVLQAGRELCAKLTSSREGTSSTLRVVVRD